MSDDLVVRIKTELDDTGIKEGLDKFRNKEANGSNSIKVGVEVDTNTSNSNISKYLQDWKTAAKAHPLILGAELNVNLSTATIRNQLKQIQQQIANDKLKVNYEFDSQQSKSDQKRNAQAIEKELASPALIAKIPKIDISNVVDIDSDAVRKKYKTLETVMNAELRKLQTELEKEGSTNFSSSRVTFDNMTGQASAVIKYNTAIGESISYTLALDGETQQLTRSQIQYASNAEAAVKKNAALSNSYTDLVGKMASFKDNNDKLLKGDFLEYYNRAKDALDNARTVDDNGVTLIDENAIADGIAALDQMGNRVSRLKAELKTGASLDPVARMANSINVADEGLEKVRLSYSQLRAPSNELADSFARLSDLKDKMNNSYTNPADNPETLVGNYRAYEDAVIKVTKAIQNEYAAQRQLDTGGDAQQKVFQNAEKYALTVERMQTRLKSIYASNSGTNWNADMSAGWDGLNSSLDAIQTKINGVKDGGVWDDSIEADISNATKKLIEFNGQLSELRGDNRNQDLFGKTIREFENLRAELELIGKERNFQGTDDLKNQYDSLLNSINAVKPKIDEMQDKKVLSPEACAEIKKINSELKAFKKQCDISDKSLKSFGSRLKDAAGQFGLFITAASVMTKVISSVKSMVEDVTKIDSSLVELQKVSDLSGNSLASFANKAFDAGSLIGRTGVEVIDATTTFKRAGYDLKESLDLANSALVMTNVGDGIDNVASASSDLIAVLRGFDFDPSKSMSIVDAINEVSNTAPIDFANITEGLTRVSGTLSQTGTTFEQTIGLITGGFSSLRNTEKVSSGLIQISQRLRGVSEDGEEIEGLAPKLKKAFKDIADIDVENSNGDLRSTYDILGDLAEQWDTMTTKERQYLGELASGNRQITVLNAVVKGWDDVTAAVDSASNSSGSATAENEKYLNSIEGKLNQFQSAMQQLSMQTVNSDLVKGIADIGTAIVKLTADIGGLQSVVIPLLAVLALQNGKKIGDFLKKLVPIPSLFGKLGKSVKTVSDGVKDLDVNASAGVGSMTGFARAANIASLAITALSIGIALYNKHRADMEATWNANIDAGKEAADQNDSLNELMATYNRLSGLTNRTSEEEDALKTAVQDVTSALGYKARALEGLTAGTTEYTEALNGLVKAQKEENTVLIKEAADSALQRVLTDLGLYGAGVDRFVAGLKDLNVVDALGGKNANIGVQNVQSFLAKAKAYGDKDFAQKIIDLIYSTANSESPTDPTVMLQRFANGLIGKQQNVDFDLSSVDKVLQTYYNLRQAKIEYDNLSDKEKKDLYQNDALYKDLAESLGMMSDGYNELLQTQMEFEKDQHGPFESLEDYNAFADAIIAKYKATGLFKQAIGEYLYTSAPDFDDVNLDTTSAITELEAMQAQIKATSDSLTLLKTNLDTLSAAQKEQAESGSISFETYTKLAEAGKEYADIIQQENGLLKLNAEATDALKGKKLEEYATEMQLSKSDVQGKYDETVRELKIRQKILDDYIKTGKYTEETIRDKKLYLSTLEDEASELADVLNSYEAITSEINSMTSAYYKYTQAMETANKSDVYESARDGIGKTVKEGLKSGKINTDEYISALEYFTGQSGTTDEERRTLGKQAKEVMGRYFTENPTQGFANLNKDLLSPQKMGELSSFFTKTESGGVNIAEGVTLDQIAEKLNMSKEALTDIFTAMQDYSTDFDFSSLFKTEELAGKTDELTTTFSEETQKIVDQATKDTAAVNAAAEKREEANQRLVEANSGGTGGSKPKPVIQKGTVKHAGAKQETEADKTGTPVPDAPVAEQNSYVVNVTLQVDPSSKATVESEIAALNKEVILNVMTNGVSTITEAKTKITELEEKIKSIKDNDSLSADAKSDLIGNAQSEIDKLKSQIEGWKTNPPTADVTITATDNTSVVVGDAQANARTEQKFVVNANTEGALGKIKELQEEAEKPATKIVTVKPSPSVPLYGDSEPSPTPSPKLVSQEPAPTATAAPESKTLVVNLDDKEAKAGLENLSSDVTDVDIVADLNDDGARREAEALKMYIQGLHPTMTVLIKQVGAIPGQASGTKHAQGGPTVVDEKGAELIEHKKSGTFEMGTNDGARLTVLDEGDIVHTASETKDIIDDEKILKGDAFASGTAKDNTPGFPSNTPTYTSGTRNNSSSKPNKDGWKKYVEKLFDWIEIRLAKLQKITDKWRQQIEDAVGYIAKNKATDQAIKALNAEMKANEEAYKRYMEQAEQIGKKSKLSDDIIKKIQDGSIDIASYSKEMQEKIKAYQEWYNKAQECADSLDDLKRAEAELKKQKIDNILGQYQQQTDKVDAALSESEQKRNLKAAQGKKITKSDYNSDIANTEDKQALLEESRKKAAAQLNALVKDGTIEEGSDDWYKYQAELDALDESILQTQIDLIDLKDAANNIDLTNKGYSLTALKESQGDIEDRMAMREAKGEAKSATDYKSLIKNGDKQVDNLKSQNDLLAQQQQGMDKMSEKYQELQAQIESNEDAINDITMSQLGWNEAIDNIKLENLGYKLSDFQQQQSEIEQQMQLDTARGVAPSSGNYVSLIKSGKDQIKNLISQNKLLMDQQSQYDVLSTKYQEIQQQLNGNESTINSILQSQEEWNDALKELAVTELQYSLNSLKQTQTEISGVMSLIEAQGGKKKESQYTGLIDNGSDQINNLQEQNRLLLSQQSGLDVLSEKYQNLQSTIDANENAIMDIKVAQEQWNDAVIDLKIQELRDYADELNKVNDKYQSQRTLMQKIEDLEKAKSQRKVKVYREGVGWVYEQDQESVRKAQDALDDELHNQAINKINRDIEDLEDSKKNSNIYDEEGNKQNEASLSNVLVDAQSESAKSIMNETQTMVDKMNQLIADKEKEPLLTETSDTEEGWRGLNDADIGGEITTADASIETALEEVLARMELPSNSQENGNEQLPRTTDALFESVAGNLSEMLSQLDGELDQGSFGDADIAEAIADQTLSNDGVGQSIFDALGNYLGKEVLSGGTFDAGNIERIMQVNEGAAITSREVMESITSAIEGLGTGIANDAVENFTFDIGDIILNNVQDVDGLAEAIKANFSSAIKRAIYTK